MMKTGAIIVAGGTGQRAGAGVAKQLRQLAGKRVFEWSVAAFQRHPDISQIVLVIPAGTKAQYYPQVSDGLTLVAGGETRTRSVQNGLDALQLTGDDIVLIHDAARPGLDQGTISQLLAAMQTADASAPALKITDALKRVSGDRLSRVARGDLYRVQTPQTFRYGQIVQALRDTDSTYDDDLESIEASGGRVKLIEGSERLAKLTYPDDFTRMARILSPSTSVPRIGNGFDVHAFEPGDQVTLCGVTIAHTHALAGHSDADVAWHALTDAILGAAALGDIGDHFPPSDPQWQGVASAVFLGHAVKLANDAGYSVASCDLTLICEAPKVQPHREVMRERTAQLLGLPLACVSVKATTTEGLGFTGRGEGIAAQASAVLSARTD